VGGSCAFGLISWRLADRLMSEPPSGGLLAPPPRIPCVRDDREWFRAFEALTALTVALDTRRRSAVPLLHTSRLAGGLNKKRT
jgi:hypothetical protein